MKSEQEDKMEFTLKKEDLPFLDRFSDKMPGGFFIYKADENEELICANAAMLRIFGCSTYEEFKEHTHNSFKGIVHPDDYADVKKSIDEQISASLFDLDYVEYRIIRKDGNVRYIEDYGHYAVSESYGPIYYVFADDATERMNERMDKIEKINTMLKVVTVRETQYKRAILHNAAAFFEANLSKNEIIYAQVREAGKKIDIINEFKNFDEYPSFTEFADNWMKHIKENNVSDYRRFFDVERLIRSYGEGNLEQVFEAETSTSDGMRLLQFVVLLGKDSATGDISILSMINDITDSVVMRRRYKAALSEANAENMMYQIFLSDLYRKAHSPLDTIRSFSEMIDYNSSNESILRYCIEKIESSSRELVNVINDAVLSKFKDEKPGLDNTECNFDILFGDLRRRIARSASEKDIHIEINTGDVRNYSVYADSVRLEEVFWQLLDNAVKFTKTGGMVTLTVSEKAGKDPEMGYYTFVVEDNGIGMKKEFIKTVFDPFERENTDDENGRGIGLTLVRQIIEMMNGKISVSSEKGKGSRFTVKLELPLKK